MPKKDSKEKEAAKKAAKAAKLASRTARSAGKQKAKAGDDDEVEEDIEVILASLAKEEAKKTAVHVEICARPSPRANASITPLPGGDFLMFGGEFWDGSLNHCYNDLFRFRLPSREATAAAAAVSPAAGDADAASRSTGVGEWKSISSPNTPGHRCSHAAVLFNGGVYVFGGEFATNNQFFHYQDTWRFDIASNRWTRFECKKGPSARSGHRMLVWRNYIVLFGGFHQAVTSERWFGDVWLFDTRSCEWREVSFPTTSILPPPRSGMQFLAIPGKDVALLYGGYSESKQGAEHSVLAAGGKKGGGSGGAALLAAARKTQSNVHTDMWLLRLAPLLTGGQPSWDRVRYAGSSPSPRLGFSCTLYKDRIILFGGVSDNEVDDRGELLDSVFHDDMYSYDVDRRRWYRLELKKERAVGSRRKNKDARVAAAAAAATADGAKADADDDAVSLGSAEGDVDVDEEEFLAARAGHDRGAGVDDDAFYYMQDGKLVRMEMEAEEGDGTAAAAPAPPGDDAPVVAAAADEADGPAAVKSSKKKKKKSGFVAADDESDAPTTPAPVAIARTPAPAASATASSATPAGAALGPSPRMKAVTWVDGHTLFVFGGMNEGRTRETTMDDAWRVDLRDRVRWECLLPATPHAWLGDASDDDKDDEDDGDSNDDDDDDDEDEEDEEDGGEADDAEAATPSAAGAARRPRGRGVTKEAARIRELRDRLGMEDAGVTPQAGEKLRDFFARTGDVWVARLLAADVIREGERIDGRTIRRKAFELARARYDELWPALQELFELEEQQRELEARAARRTGGGPSARKGK